MTHLDELRRCLVDNAGPAMLPPAILAKAILELDERLRKVETDQPDVFIGLNPDGSWPTKETL